MKFFQKTDAWKIASALLLVTAVSTGLILQNTSPGSTSEGLVAESVFNLSKQAENSDVVVVAEVTDIGSTETETQQLEDGEVERTYRTISLRTEELLKGDNPGRIQVRSYSHSLPAQYREGEKALFFLEDMGDYYVTKGGEYGKYTVENNSINRETVSGDDTEKVSMEKVRSLVSTS